jgi:hypothetical protein
MFSKKPDQILQKKKQISEDSKELCKEKLNLAAHVRGRV